MEEFSREEAFFSLVVKPIHKGGEFTDGEKWTVRFGLPDSTPKTYGRLEPKYPTEPRDVVTVEHLGGSYADSVVISGRDLKQHKAAKAENKIFALRETAAEDFKAKARLVISSDLWLGDATATAGNGGRRVLGLVNALPVSSFPGVHTLGGLAFASYPDYQHVVANGTDGDNGNFAEDFYQVITEARAATKRTKEKTTKKADMAFTTQVVANKLKNYVFRRANPNIVMFERNQIGMKDGIPAPCQPVMMIDDMPLYIDENVPANRIFMCHKDAFVFKSLDQDIFDIRQDIDEDMYDLPEITSFTADLIWYPKTPALCAWVLTDQ